MTTPDEKPSIPEPKRPEFDLEQVIQEQQHKRGIAAIINMWPGNESDEEIEQALKELS